LTTSISIKISQYGQSFYKMCISMYNILKDSSNGIYNFVYISCMLICSMRIAIFYSTLAK